MIEFIESLKKEKHFRIIAYGSYKTTFVLNLTMNMIDDFDYILIIAEYTEEAKYEYLKTKNYKNVDIKDVNWLKGIDLLEQFENKGKSLIILDDIHFCIKNNEIKNINELVIRARIKNISFCDVNNHNCIKIIPSIIKELSTSYFITKHDNEHLKLIQSSLNI